MGYGARVARVEPKSGVKVKRDVFIWGKDEVQGVVGFMKMMATKKVDSYVQPEVGHEVDKVELKKEEPSNVDGV